MEGSKGLGAEGAAPGHLAAGTPVGEYVIEGVLGRGGMGTVYAARQPLIGKRVAIKVLAADFSNDPAIVRRFVDEARAVNKIGHPNIIDIFSFGTLGDGRQYFVMEYLEGETLGTALGRGPLPADEARRLFAETCAALEAAHRERIVHRDLKPDNLWIARPRHGPSFMKVLDFGIAKLLEPADGSGTGVTETGAVMGTPQFMAPEQCLGEPVDHRVDIYALGVIFYRAFCGRLPFAGKSFAEVVAQMVTVAPPRPSSLGQIPPALEALILACMDKEPGRRPQSAADVGTRLAQALAGPSTAADAPTQAAPRGRPPAPELAAPAAQRWWPWALVGLAVALALGSLALFVRGKSPPPPPVATPSAMPAPLPAPVAPAESAATPASAAPATPSTEEQTAPPAARPRNERTDPRGGAGGRPGTRLPWGRKNPYQ